MGAHTDASTMKFRRDVLSPSQVELIAQGGPLPADSVHYFTHVLRLKTGERVEIGDGRGRILRGSLSRSGAEWVLTDKTWWTPIRAPLPPLTVMVGILKAKRWRILVEKAVELGVDTVVPVITERTVVRPQPHDLEQFVHRWQRVVREAGKQCGRPLLTQVEPPIRLAEALDEIQTPNRIVGVPGGHHCAWQQKMRQDVETIILIGPEGGLTEQELAGVGQIGFQPVSLGAYPLRAETAAIALVAMVRDRLGLIVSESEGVPCR